MLIKILVVDDSATDVLIIKNILKDFELLVARDGTEAISCLEEHKDINIVILDLNMPKMNGFQVLELFKSDDTYKHLRVIVLTNYDEQENEIRALQLGAVDFIRKPLNMDSLKARIKIHADLLLVEYHLEQKIKEKDLTFDTIFNQVPVGIAISYEQGENHPDKNPNLNINRALEEITGRTKNELIKMGWASITHPEDLEKDLNYYKKLKAGVINGYAMDKRYIKPDGSIVWVHMIVRLLDISQEDQFNHISIVQDITKRKEIEAELIESERSKSVLLSHIPGLAYRCKYDPEWTMEFVSEGCFELTGYHSESLLNNKDLSFNDLISPEYQEILWEEWKKVISEKANLNYEYEIKTASGEKKWVLEMGQGIFNENGEVEALEGIVFDISDRKKVENELRYSNEHDRWTGLKNRNFLEALLESDLKSDLINKKALISVNLSDLQLLTAIYGFHYTQEVVKNLVKILQRHTWEECELYKTYENRFVFYLKKYNSPQELESFCKEISQTLMKNLAPERIGGGIGVIEINSGNKNDVDVLLKNILIASEKAIVLYEKDFGICFYDEKMEAQNYREQEIIKELSAIASQETEDGLFLQFQPILHLESNKICGFEALARLNSEKIGSVSPLEFIPIAEKTKLIIPIGKKVALLALNFLKKLETEGYDDINLSINVSVIELLKEDFVSNMIEMIKSSGVKSSNVCIEITESVFAANLEEINIIIEELKEHNVKIAIDDFGTGYSSLAREGELNVDCLKIDKYFVDNLLIVGEEKAITGDIVSIAHKFKHITIAEGVETETQRKYLEKYNCDKIQGYLISRPLDEDDALSFLKEYNGR